MYFSAIDYTFVEVKTRFSCHSFQLANSGASLSSASQKFFDIEMLEPLIDHLSLEKNAIHKKISLIKPVIKDTKLITMIDILNELKPIKKTFPSIVALIKGPTTFSVSFVACERSFSKMKLFKNYAQNSINDETLSDLSTLVIER